MVPTIRVTATPNPQGRTGLTGTREQAIYHDRTDVSWRKIASGSRRSGPNCPLCRVHAPRKALTMCVEEVGARECRPCSASTSSPSRFLPPHRNASATAVGCADAADGRSKPRWNGSTMSTAPDDLRRSGSRGAGHEPPRSAWTYLALAQPGYPGLLASIADPPIGLWVRGRLPERPRVAVIGSRAASPAALKMARRLAAGLARHGVCRRERAGARLRRRRAPGGLDARRRDHRRARMRRRHQSIQPSTRRWRDAIAAHGAVVSEFPPGTPPLPHPLPAAKPHHLAD